MHGEEDDLHMQFSVFLSQVSFGIHETEEQAARQYDRALIVEKGRSAKTNFPLSDYEKEMTEYEELLHQQ